MENGDIYERLAAAAVRGYAFRTGADGLPPALLEKPLDGLTAEDTAALLEAGRVWGVKLYRFKRSHETLPRVRFALGFLRSAAPDSLCDVGSGRGAFLFPFLNAFPAAAVTSLEILETRAAFLRDIRAGGVGNLTPLLADVCAQPLPGRSVDVVTLLEVLEHIPDVRAAIRAAVRMARRYVVVTAPSKPDDNPEHIHLLTREALTEYFKEADAAARLNFGGVPEHLTLVVKVGGT